MTIYVGPAGVSPSAKDRSSLGGVRRAGEVGLNAMEIEFVRGVKMKPELAKEVGEAAKESGVRLSVHAPYYINLLSSKPEIVKASVERIVDSLHRGELMGADAIAVHAAYFGDYTPEQAMKLVKERIVEILDKAEKKGADNIRFGLETMAKRGQWGSLEEITEVHKEFGKRVVPYLDWGHLYCRGEGKVDYKSILNHMKKLKLGHINSHFTCVKWSDKQKAFVDVHQPLAKKDPPFAPLAKILAKSKIDITLICETPYIEKDALVMKQMLEKEGYKFR